MSDVAAPSADCYGVRILSPYRGIFRGVMQVAEGPGARAMSADGLVWRVQGLTVVSKSGWGSLDKVEDRSRYVLYGGWSKRDGFHQAPLPPTCDIDRLRQTCDPLVALMSEIAARVPFERRDHNELWLLDARDAAPLALLASTVDASSINTAIQPSWEPTAGSDTTFTAPSLLARGVENRSGGRHSYHRDVLKSLVQRAAGRPVRAQWFRREGGGGVGIDGVGLDADLTSRRLRAEDFPPLLLREDWDEAEQRSLVADFVDFMAPYLLTLNDLDPALRQRLERAAVRQAALVYRLHRLYPDVVDQSLLNRTLVEAVMRHAAEADVSTAD